jgi:tetratricopeptide (TPR) repeat protein
LASPYSDAEPVDTGDRVEAGMSAEEGATMVRTNYAEMSSRARRGRLDEAEMLALADIPSKSDQYRPSRALLLAQYEAAGQREAHCDIAREVVGSRANRTDPQFNLELGKCLLREGSYQDALKVARLAEQNAQDIPSRIRTDRQLKIWEVQAKAYKGLYQNTENLDYIDNSIVVWKRYLNMAKHTYRQREADQAGDEIRALNDLARGAL